MNDAAFIRSLDKALELSRSADAPIKIMSDRDALIAAIKANPHDHTPRLIFADYLDENGDLEGDPDEERNE
jgi:uncharacterized protein (TIGR02996 family)